MYLKTKQMTVDSFPWEDEDLIVNECWECDKEKDFLVCIGEDSEEPESLKEIEGTTFVCEDCLKKALGLIKAKKRRKEERIMYRVDCYALVEDEPVVFECMKEDRIILCCALAALLLYTVFMEENHSMQISSMRECFNKEITFLKREVRKKTVPHFYFQKGNVYSSNEEIVIEQTK